jgi:hypothetical protein
MRDLLVTSVRALVLTPVILASLSIVGAQVMESNNYHIQSDSINFGGGLSTSTNYSLESTAGESGTGESESASYSLKAGYQQMLESYISISDFAAVTMSPSIPGVSGGYADGSTTVRVITDSPSGYTLSIASVSDPALTKGSDSIADYAPVGAAPDYTYITDASDAHFGYTPEGSDIVSRFKDNGSACNTGGLDTSLACWDGLSTSEEIIAQSTGSNHPSGTVTTLNFRVGIGGMVVQTPGSYTATTTITALTL